MSSRFQTRSSSDTIRLPLKGRSAICIKPSSRLAVSSQPSMESLSPSAPSSCLSLVSYATNKNVHNKLLNKKKTRRWLRNSIGELVGCRIKFMTLRSHDCVTPSHAHLPSEFLHNASRRVQWKSSFWVKNFFINKFLQFSLFFTTWAAASFFSFHSSHVDH